MNALVALLVLAAGAPTEVSFRVDKAGLKWTAPCSADFFVEGQDAPKLKHRDVSQPASVAPGKYLVQVRCPSTEGALAKTFKLTVRGKKAVLRAKLRPGFALVKVLRDKAEVEADLVFYDDHGLALLSGRERVAHPLPPGKVQLVATLRRGVDARATGRRDVRATGSLTVPSGKKRTITLDISDGQLELKLLHNGSAAEGSGALYLPGTRREVARVIAGKASEAPPGVYDLATRLDESHDFTEVKKRRVKIKPGKTARVTMVHRTGQLSVDLVRGGLPLVAGEAADIELFHGGKSKGSAGAAFNTLALNETAILAPGSYRVRATLKGRENATGSVVAEQRVKIDAYKAKKVKLDLSSSELAITGTVGGKAQRLTIEVIRKGDVIVRRKTGRDGLMAVPVSPGWYGVRAILEAEQGYLETRREVKVARGKSAALALDLNLGRAAIQVFEGGVAIPAEVAFQREDAAEPMLRAPAGQEVYLPPGRYLLTVGRGSFERTYSAVTVGPGGLVERQLELIDEDGQTPEQIQAAKERKLRLKGR